MDKSSKLIPSNIKAQCDEAIRLLEENKRCLFNVLANVQYFVEDTSIESDAFAAMRTQIENYTFVIDLMRMANEADIEDYKKLKDMVGDEELDGAKLIAQLEEAKRQQAANAKMLESIRSSSTKADSETKKYNMQLIKDYESVADYDDKIIKEIQAKIDFYDEVDSSSAGLFKTGRNFRNSAKSALSEAKGSSVSGGTYKCANPAFAHSILANMSTTQLLQYNQKKYTIATSNDEVVEKNKVTNTIKDNVAISNKDGIFMEKGFTNGYSALSKSKTTTEDGVEITRTHNIANINSEGKAKVSVKDKNGNIVPGTGEKLEVDFSYYQYNQQVKDGNASTNNTVNFFNLKGVANNKFGYDRDTKEWDLKLNNGLSMSVADMNAKGKVDILGYTVEYKIEGDFLKYGVEEDISKNPKEWELTPRFELFDGDMPEIKISKKK